MPVFTRIIPFSMLIGMNYSGGLSPSIESDNMAERPLEVWFSRA